MVEQRGPRTDERVAQRIKKNARHAETDTYNHRFARLPQGELRKLQLRKAAVGADSEGSISEAAVGAEASRRMQFLVPYPRQPLAPVTHGVVTLSEWR